MNLKIYTMSSKKTEKKYGLDNLNQSKIKQKQNRINHILLIEINRMNTNIPVLKIRSQVIIYQSILV